MTTIAQHWIDGEWIDSDTVAESVNPATGEVLGQWYDGGEAEARACVAAARRAFDTSSWARDRGLRNQVPEMADRFASHADELGRLVTQENGKKLAEGLFEAIAGPDAPAQRGYALTETGISAEVAPGQWFTTYSEPAGVVGIIVPWNSPVALSDPFPRSCPCRREHRGRQDAGQTALVANLRLPDHL